MKRLLWSIPVLLASCFALGCTRDQKIGSAQVCIVVGEACIVVPNPGVQIVGVTLRLVGIAMVMDLELNDGRVVTYLVDISSQLIDMVQHSTNKYDIAVVNGWKTCLRFK